MIFSQTKFLPAGLLCRRRLISDVRLSVRRSFVRPSPFLESFTDEDTHPRHSFWVLIHGIKSQAVKNRSEKTEFLQQRNHRRKSVFEKGWQKITELDNMDKLVIFSQTGLVCTVQNQEQSHVLSCLKVGSRHIDALEKLDGGCTKALRATLALRV